MGLNAPTRDRNYRAQYGITLAEVEQMLDTQNGRCLICDRDLTVETPKGFTGYCVDHDHITKRVRGLLCHGCNRHLGWYEIYHDQMHKYLASQ